MIQIPTTVLILGHGPRRVSMIKETDDHKLYVVTESFSYEDYLIEEGCFIEARRRTAIVFKSLDDYLEHGLLSN